MNVDLIFAIFAGILLVIGFIGTFVPVLPGAPLAWLGLLLAFFSDYCKISISGLIITGIFAVLVSVLDNFFPIFMTKKFGGSKAAITGSNNWTYYWFFCGTFGYDFGTICWSVHWRVNSQ